MRRILIALACAALALLTMRSFTAPALAATSLSGSGAASFRVRDLLARDFVSADLSYAVLDLQTNSVIAERWPANDRAIPVGSLVKPFVAIAYAESHAYRFPEHECVAGTCWLPRGHGKLDLVHAVAMSCNSYFTSLAENVNAQQVGEVARHFGLAGPPLSASPAAMAGRYGEWRESPEAMLRAYGEMLQRREQPGIVQIVAGMQQSAAEGTAGAIAKEVPHLSVLAKTGTAPCTHTPAAPGDGFVMAAWPSDSPRYLLMLRQHGRPGAVAAITAGQMIRAVERGH